ncbi:MAG: hypothetical protein HKL82_09925 [Acidimicrobiaceae bacterium]|nr:hypothetical protein [Acidimicrobiaceae bacterium]
MAATVWEDPGAFLERGKRAPGPTPDECTITADGTRIDSPVAFYRMLRDLGLPYPGDELAALEAQEATFVDGSCVASVHPAGSNPSPTA